MRDGWKRTLRAPRSVDRQAARDVDEEIQFHLDTRAEELISQGVDPEAAREQAAAEFGDVDAARDMLTPTARRGERFRRIRKQLDELRWDVREASRGLMRARGFTTVAILTLALTIGANTGIFSVADAVLFRSLPYADPDRIVQVMEAEVPEFPRNHISSATYIDWKNQATSFETFGAYSVQLPLVLTAPDAPAQHVETVNMTPDAFRVLGAAPALGRLFTEEEGLPGAPRLAVVSWPFWQNRLGGAEDVLGRVLTLDDQDYEIVGVMRPGFAFPDHDVEVWPSLRFATSSDGANRQAHQWQALGRLAPGVSAETADAELDAISARLELTYPNEMTGWRARVQTFRADLTREVRPLVWVILGVVITVLLVACANLANLMLARFTAQRGELAIRTALGAGRARLVRRVLVESGLLALVGGVLGVAIAFGMTRLLVSLAPSDIPLLETTRVDGTTLAFAFLATAASTLLFGLLPAVRSTRTDPGTLLQEGRRGSGGGQSQARLRSAILVSEIALSSLLLIGAGLMIRTMIAHQQVEYGYDVADLHVATVRLPTAAYPSLVEQQAFFEPLRERLAAIPGVIEVGATSEPPVVGYQMSFGYSVRGQPRPGPERMEDAVQLRAVTPEYFDALRQRVTAGRGFSQTDGRDAPAVAIVNEAMARMHWSADGPVGGALSTESPEGAWREIVGVVEDTRHRGAVEALPAFYVPYDQKDWDWLSWQSFMIRTSGAPLTRETIDEAVWAFDRSLVIERFEPVDGLYADSRARSRFVTQLMVVFAGLALLLGAIGLYGVLSYAVNQRRREIGVRIAMGAGKGAIASLVLKNGLGLTALGLGIGLGAAWLSTAYLETLLFGVETRDPLTFITIPVVLGAVAALACWLPARSAAGTEPAIVLRE